MNKRKNYVIGVGPVGLITAQTLIENNENVVLISPPQNELSNFSVRDTSFGVVDSNIKDEFGGVARIWENQCTRISENAFNTLGISQIVRYEEYLKCSQEVEWILQIYEWPTPRTHPIWKSNVEDLSIFETCSVLAPFQSWDKIFENVIRSQKVSLINAEVASIKSVQPRELVLTDGNKIVLGNSDRVFLAAGTLGNYRILKSSQLIPKGKLLFPLDHPSLYAARLSGVHDEIFRELFKETSSGLMMKKKYAVEGKKIYGIFEIREKWEKNLGSILKRGLNRVLKIFGMNTLFLPQLFLWVQIAQERDSKLHSDYSDFSSDQTWSASLADIISYGIIVESAEAFLKTYNIFLTKKVNIKFTSKLNAISSEAYHPSGIIDIEDFTKLQIEGITVLGASILDNLSWNNPTLPSMAISRQIVKNEIRKISD
jgi:hypothetical protein